MSEQPKVIVPISLFEKSGAIGAEVTQMAVDYKNLAGICAQLKDSNDKLTEENKSLAAKLLDLESPDGNDG